MCAPGSVDKIVSNLLMNGIKYCRSAVSLILERIPGDKVRIRVDSDGAPVAQEERDLIFEPFYQSPKTHSRISKNEGTGLGLSFARSLAVLHNGTLTLDPSFRDGNSFVLELPAGQLTEKTETSEEEYLQNDEMEAGKYSVLVVEDDATLNDYIRTELAGEYTIYQAYDGKQALSILNEKSISLIVSDIMMPEMNGCELVDVVKNTLRFSHIPIILLTAVTDYNTQLESLHSGADGYITKPFSMQILRATIFNTLKNREILYERFSSLPYTRPENNTGSQDEVFMKQLYDYVMENISNQDFSVLDLADKMMTSRSTLFRKIRANTGMNINEYIRVCRLKKAAELLSTQKYQTKEVAYMVGFTTMSYFTKSFQKQFNISPSSLLKKKQSTDKNPET
jgi:DNA-binding response OmpR family regulator